MLQVKPGEIPDPRAARIPCKLGFRYKSVSVCFRVHLCARLRSSGRDLRSRPSRGVVGAAGVKREAFGVLSDQRPSDLPQIPKQINSCSVFAVSSVFVSPGMVFCDMILRCGSTTSLSLRPHATV